MTLPAALRNPHWTTDAVLCGAATVVVLALSAHIPADGRQRPLDGTALVLLVIAGISTGVCRRWPRLATIAVTAVLCVFVARDYPNSPVWITGWVVLVVLALRTDRRTSVVGIAGMMTALSVTAIGAGHGGLLESVLYIGWGVAGIALGELIRTQRGYIAERRERNAAILRTREQELARRLAEDRLCIARDLHDGVAHAMATINVQAGAAIHLLSVRPEVAGEALAVIQRASGEVLEELSVILAVLREDGRAADLLPTPGLWDIARLVDSTTQSGLRVDLTMNAPSQQVPSSVSTAAYRVVQESLTNVMRHSASGAAAVSVTARPDSEIDVRIVDAGPARTGAAKGTGAGIRGMRERVTTTGGSFLAGATPDGGFAVSARWRRGG
ncbi:sensor histidine kinase [Flexivirga caeni]|uniref:histidine kinase n=1 Tax=Flexivirga caeni TaxID=2294115 RepID=A0A3M9LZ93_9MICO|nr:histidine kinase [Flexivirga caeni]RNI17943.1 hypothetical protein EFY87_18735 [Flexivirga caeni]